MKLYHVYCGMGSEYLIWAETPNEALECVQREDNALTYSVYEVDATPQPRGTFAKEMHLESYSRQIEGV